MNFGLRRTSMTSIPGGTSGMHHPNLMEDGMGCRGGAFCDCTGFGGEDGRDQSDLQNKLEEIER